MDDLTGKFPAGSETALWDHLAFLYSPAVVDELIDRLLERLRAFTREHPELLEHRGERVSEKDVILITYGDQVQETGVPPLRSLYEFLEEHTGDFLTGVHILPFFPFTSDDGFSVADYLSVSPLLGEWDDIVRIAARFRLMVDLVVNHVSASHDWFKGFRIGDPTYAEYFIAVEPDEDLSMVVRPRALPLLTPFETALGLKHVWTTFSADQVDLNFSHPEVLLAMTDVLLEYLVRGSRFIRLDAIAYLWKERGSPCIHLEQTHRVVRFWRTVLDMVAPGRVIITETNVPHAENVSYFGDGTNEAQAVYNFSLPPLTLHAIASGNARYLREWAATLETPSEECTFFNFLASHDGIGVRPAEGILSREEIEGIAARVVRHGGYVSLKNNPDGSQSPYELNINYFDALNDPSADEPESLQIARFLVAQAILLSLAGVPGIYVHSLFGSRSWPEGVAASGRFRTINRQKFQRDVVDAELADPSSLRYKIFRRYREMIRARTSEPAFHPQGAQHLLDVNPALFAFIRVATDGARCVLCLHNVSARRQEARVDLSGARAPVGKVTDILSGERLSLDKDGVLALTLEPYSFRWFGYQASEANGTDTG